MLHPLNPPDCAAELEYLIYLQQRTLEFAAVHSTFRDDDYAGFVGADFVQWLNSKRGTEKSVMRFFNDLPSLLKLDSTDKFQVVSDFVADQSFFAHLDDRNFRFRFSPTITEAHQRAAPILVCFYDFLGIRGGYPANVMSALLSGLRGLRRVDVVGGYKSTNPGIDLVCPVCDNAITDSGNGVNAEGYTLEHYFPKSLYPSVCLHPLNLFPTCSKCNSEKANKDPLAPVDRSNTSHPVPFDEIFHPMERSVSRLTDLVFEDSPQGESMKFISRAPARSYSSSITAYEILYGIPPRWKNAKTRIDKRVELSVIRASKMYQAVNRVTLLNEADFEEILGIAIGDLQEQFGSESLSYPACKWLEWAKDMKFNLLYSSFNN